MIRFVRRYHQSFVRIDDRYFIGKEDLLGFLRDAPIALIVSSGPDLDGWIEEDQVNGVWTMDEES